MPFQNRGISTQASAPSSTRQPQAPGRQPLRRRLVRTMLLYIALPYLIICAIFCLIQRQLMYPARVVSTAEVSSLLTRYDNVRALQVTTADELRLNGILWQKTSGESDSATDDSGSRPRATGDRPSEPVVLYFPGNGGCRFDRLDICERFSELGCSVVLFDYRGYAENPGSPSEKKIIQDAHAIWDLLTKAMHIPSSQIVIYGESLGGGVAMRLAADLSREGSAPAALLVSSTFSSMTDTACYHYPFLPARLLLFDRYNSQSYISDITCPIVMVHGTSDEIVPFKLGKRLFEKAAARSSAGLAKQFIEAPGAGHNDVPLAVLCRALEPLIRALQPAR